MTYRTGNHHGVTIVDESPGTRCGRPRHDCARGHLVAVVVDGGEELAERIVRGLHLLALSEKSEPKTCTEEVLSWDHFNPEQVDRYWIRCTRSGPHDVHEDETTGLTWRAEAES